MKKDRFCNICGKMLDQYDTYQYQNELICGSCNKLISENPEITKEEVINQKKALEELLDTYIIVTVPSIEGKKITKYFNMITSETVIGTGIASEFGASIFDLLGTTGAYSDKLKEVKQRVYYDLKKQAVSFGANAIVGAEAEYMKLGSNMIMFSVSGTPVIIEDD